MKRESRLSFRKLKIFISQTKNSHFANYIFSFRKLQILISQTADFHLVFYGVSVTDLALSSSFSIILSLISTMFVTLIPDRI